MRANDIRNRFLKFFEARGHRVVPSSSLVPANDPTLLFTNAGMNQFKDVFLGHEKPPSPRAASCQKCVRAGGKHNDLEQVGRTRRHHTFFEMLGNFSFGDYFKAEAIPWAWELVTQDFELPTERLYATVFREDDEAEQIWAKIVPRDRIFRFDEKDNFWAMGETGPCGPCSEIHYDMGPEASDLGHKDCKFPCPQDCGRYVEIWNLVFMQFNRARRSQESGVRSQESGTPDSGLRTSDFVLTPLPRPSIDTGAGLERLAAVLQGKVSNFDTDLFKPLIDEAAELANTEYGANHETDISLRIIADHARAATFLITDGVLPTNEGRGYVLRLILRRALYHGQTLGLNEPFLFKMSGHVVDLMKEAYPGLPETAPHAAKAIKIEEERYAQTTRVGLDRLKKAGVVLTLDNATGLETEFEDWQSAYSNHNGDCEAAVRAIASRHAARKAGPTAPPPFAGWVPGEDLFLLHDTYGLRPDFVADIVRNYGLTLDLTGYEAVMLTQRERARAGWSDKATDILLAGDAYKGFAGRHKTTFVGYQSTGVEGCRVLGVILVETTYPAPREGRVDVVLDRTPFYAESGGQVGDTGWLRMEGRDVARVLDTFSPITGLIVHKVQWLTDYVLTPEDRVTAVVDAERRDAIRRNHTGTHLLHAALRTVLGTHVKQAGSLVAPDRLRFDFSHYAALSEQDRLDIEDLVNEHVLKNEEVVTNVMELDKAVESGAMALFGEKYGDQVRVVSIADGSFSKELCGGTHVRRTGDIGLFKIISESSVSAGTRRVEALTGTGVLGYLRKASGTLALLSERLRAKPEELIEAAEKLAETEKKLRKQLESQQAKRAAAEAGDLLEKTQIVKGVKVLAARVDLTDRAAMRQMVDTLRPRLASGVIFLGTVADGPSTSAQGGEQKSNRKVALIAAVTKDLTSRLDAVKIVKQAAALVGGAGGGRKDLAEAGGTLPEKLDESLAAVLSIIEKML